MQQIDLCSQFAPALQKWRCIREHKAVRHGNKQRTAQVTLDKAPVIQQMQDMPHPMVNTSSRVSLEESGLACGVQAPEMTSCIYVYKHSAV